HWVDTLVILGVTVINALIVISRRATPKKSLQGIRNMLSSDAHWVDTLVILGVTVINALIVISRRATPKKSLQG
ncbi:hypothetical protein CQA77_30330, partial [Klebsiella pneumoniae]